MLALFAGKISMGRIMENAKQLTGTFCKKNFGMFNTSSIYYDSQTF